MQNAQVKDVPVKSPSAAPTRKKRGKSLERSKARAGWVFISPFVIGFVIIYLPVVWESIWLSFNKIHIAQGGGFTLEFMGLENYAEALFVDANFVRTLTTGLQQLVLDIPSIIIFALFIAILLNQKMVGRAAFRAIFFIPVILATGIIDRIDQGNQLLEYLGSESTIDTGATNTDSSVTEIISLADVSSLFMNMQVGTELVMYVVQMVNNIYNIVNRSGVQMLIFLAGLQSISPAIYESAFMEGASAWETFWKITFPMISPMILVNAVYTVIDSFTAKSNSVMRLIETTYSSPGGNVLSSAMSWIYFLIVVLVIAAVAGVLSVYVFYQRRD